LLAALEHLAQRYRNLDLDVAAARRARGSVPEQASEPGGGSAEDVGEVDAAPQILRAGAGQPGEPARVVVAPPGRVGRGGPAG
jgi:hypothetical protein